MDLRANYIRFGVAGFLFGAILTGIVSTCSKRPCGSQSSCSVQNKLETVCENADSNRSESEIYELEESSLVDYSNEKIFTVPK